VSVPKDTKNGEKLIVKLYQDTGTLFGEIIGKGTIIVK